jgi:hypothetical protein
MSKFFVVSKNTGGREGNYKSYKTMRGAENFAKRLNAKYGDDRFEAVSAEFYAEVLSKRTTVVKNMLTGKEVTIPLVDRGTCVDPSTERYFSM